MMTPIRWGLKARLTLRVALLVLAVTAGLGLLLVTTETVGQHALLVKDGELLAQTLAAVAARYPEGEAQAALTDVFGRASARFDVEEIAITDAGGLVIAAQNQWRVGERFEPGRFSLHSPAVAPSVRLQSVLEPVRIEVTAPVLDGDEARGFVYLRFRSAQVVERARATVRTILYVLGFFLAVGVGVSALFVARITRPLRALAEAAQALGEGEAVEVPTSGRDEVWLLADRLNAMSRRLRERAEENGRLVQDLKAQSRDLEDRVAKAVASLGRADKLASLGTISASLNHELGNYANVIRGYCVALMRDLSPESRARADVAAIHGVNEHAILLLDRFALFARPRAQRLEPHAPAALVGDAAALLAPRLREQGVGLVQDLPADLPMVQCDPGLLVQAFFNVLLNALQAMGHAGRIVVAGRAEVGVVVLTFQDAGCGIPADVLPRVFDPFVTTKPEGEGTGLGLAIVYRIVEIHRGRVAMESEVGRGTTVRFELPAAGGAP